MRILALLFFFFIGTAQAVVYIDCSCSTNGDGTGQTCGASGPKNVAVTTVAASTEYSYARGSTCTLVTTSITVNQNSVTLSAYGTGENPIIDGNGASYALTVTTSNDFSVSGLDFRTGTTGAVNLSSTTTGGTFSNNKITTSLVGLAISAAGATNITGSGNRTICTGMASICWNIATNGGGISFSDSYINLTASDRSSTSLIGVRLSGTATTLNNVDVVGGNMGVEVRTTNGHTVKNGEYSGQLVSGVRLRDSKLDLVAFNTFHDIDNLVAYPSGQGNAIDMIDIGSDCGGNVIVGNNMHAVYQGIVDQCDFSGTAGGNYILSNALWDYSVDGISYQSSGLRGYIVGNSLSHYPRSLVGHAIVVQNGSSTAMSATIVNNACVVGIVGNNVQCVSIPDSANTGATFLNNNDWYAAVSGAHIGKLDTVSPSCASGSTPAWCNYDTLAAWQTALGTDADTTGDESASLSTQPKWVQPLVPTSAQGFRLTAASPLRGVGYDLNIGNIQDNGNRAFHHPPSIGAWEATSGDLATERTLR